MTSDSTGEDPEVAMSRSMSSRADWACSRSRIAGGKASESPLFSPPANAKGDELKRAQLLQGSENLKIGIREARSMAFKEYGSVSSYDAQMDLSPPATASNQTNDLLQLLVSEIARMRSTLDSLAQDRALLAEVQRTNKLLALSLVSAHRLEYYCGDRSAYTGVINENAKAAEVILKTLH